MQTLNASSFGSSLDTSLKTPYSYTLDLSVERDLGAGFSLDLAYVGRLSHRLLSSQDVAQPLDLRDKKSGLDYFSAIQPLTRLYELQGVNDTGFKDSMVSSAVVQYWTNMLQAPINGGAYALGRSERRLWRKQPHHNHRSRSGYVRSILRSRRCRDHCASGSRCTSRIRIRKRWNTRRDRRSKLRPVRTSPLPILSDSGAEFLLQPQYVSLFAQRSIGFSNYNALQVTLRHQMSHGFQFDFNYTYSKSIDLCSDAERLGNSGSLNFNGGCQIFNAWSPDLFRAVSDFDTTHQLNANWIVDLPFGRGRAIAGWCQSGPRCRHRGLAAFRPVPVDQRFPLHDLQQPGRLPNRLVLGRCRNADRVARKKRGLPPSERQREPLSRPGCSRRIYLIRRCPVRSVCVISYAAMAISGSTSGCRNAGPCLGTTNTISPCAGKCST